MRNISDYKKERLKFLLSIIENHSKEYMTLKGCTPENQGHLSINFDYNDNFELLSTTIDATFPNNRRKEDRKK